MNLGWFDSFLSTTGYFRDFYNLTTSCPAPLTGIHKAVLRMEGPASAQEGMGATDHSEDHQETWHSPELDANLCISRSCLTEAQKGSLICSRMVKEEMSVTCWPDRLSHSLVLCPTFSAPVSRGDTITSLCATPDTSLGLTNTWLLLLCPPPRPLPFSFALSLGCVTGPSKIGTAQKDGLTITAT